MKKYIFQVPSEENKLVHITTVMILICSILLILDYISIRSWKLVIIASSFLALSLVNYVIFINKKKYSFWSSFFVIISGICLAFLFYDGGTEGSGLLWPILFPFLAFVFKGAEEGFKYILGFIILLFAIFIISLLGYSPLHFPVSYMVIYFFTILLSSVFLLIIGKRKADADESLNERDKIFSHSIDMLYVSGFDGYFKTLNPSWTNTMGWTIEELMSKPLIDFLHPDDRAAAKKARSDIDGEQKCITLENRFLCKNGQYRYLSWKSYPDNDDECIYGVVRDVTEEKIIMKKLSVNEIKYRLITENSSDVIWLYNIDQQRYSYISPSVYQLRGLTVEDAQKQTLEESLAPDSRGIAKKIFEHEYPVYLQNKEAYEGKYILLPVQQPCKDGSYVWVEASMKLRTNENGETEILGVTRNIDERKRLEAGIEYKNNLQKIVSKYSADFINSTPENIDNKINDLLKQCGFFLNVDRASVFLFSQDRVYVNNIYEWCSEGTESVKHKYMNLRLDKIKVFQDVIRESRIIYLPDASQYSGDVKFFEDVMISEKIKTILLLPMIKDNMLIGYLDLDSVKVTKEYDENIQELLLVIAHIIADALEKNKLDIKLRDTSLELQQINATKDKLFSIIAHDLRSPFNSFIGFTDLMAQEDSELSIEEIRGYSKMLNQLAQNSYGLLENLLEWSRLQRGILKPQAMEVYLRDFIIQVVGIYSRRIKEKNQLVHVNVEPQLKVMLDRRMIESVIKNILSNAIKFTPQGGVITINAKMMPSDNLRIWIHDTGIGIPPSIIPELFSVNEKKSRAGTDGERSSGLGLMICKEFMDILRGKIWAESVEFKGSDFFIEIPQNIPD